MGGEGSMMAANNSLKNNRSLVSKRKEKKALSGSYSNLELKAFPEATPEHLTEVREKIQDDNRRVMKKRIALFVFFILAIIAFFAYLIQ